MSADQLSVEELWAADRHRVGVCVSVIPKARRGVTYDALRSAVFAVTWHERELTWHESRLAPSDDGTEGWVLEATCSCLASSGDEIGVAYRVEGLAQELVEETEVVLTAPCHIPFLRLTLDDIAVDLATGLAAPTPTPTPTDTTPASSEIPGKEKDATETGDGAFGDSDEGKSEMESKQRMKKEEEEVEVVHPRKTAAELFRETGLAASTTAVDPLDVERLSKAATRRMAAAEVRGGGGGVPVHSLFFLIVFLYVNLRYGSPPHAGPL